MHKINHKSVASVFVKGSRVWCEAVLSHDKTLNSSSLGSDSSAAQGTDSWIERMKYVVANASEHGGCGEVRIDR